MERQSGFYFIASPAAKWCPVPVNPETNGTVTANSTGNRYGKVCAGADGESESSGFCPQVSLIYTNVSYGRARHTFRITSDTSRSDFVFFKVRFDAPITGTFVSAKQYRSSSKGHRD